MVVDVRLSDLAEYIDISLPGVIFAKDLSFGQLTIEVNPSDSIKLFTFLRDDPKTQFKLLIDIAGVDWPENSKRFSVVYNFLSLKGNLRIRVKIHTADGEPLPSITGVYRAAGWYEREAWDLYGIKFSDNPDLRRILTDYGFKGHPMRKDFPLTGHVEVRYDEEKKRVVYEPVELTQEFRTFDFMSPWEGAEYILPGDEKVKNIENNKEKDK